MGKCNILSKVKTTLEENNVDLDTLKSFEKEIGEAMVTYNEKNKKRAMLVLKRIRISMLQYEKVDSLTDEEVLSLINMYTIALKGNAHNMCIADVVAAGSYYWDYAAHISVDEIKEIDNVDRKKLQTLVIMAKERKLI